MSLPEKVDCVVLAGAPADDATREQYGVQWRSDVPIAGRPMLHWLLDALKASGSIGELVVIGVGEYPGCRFVAPGETFFDNFMRGINALEGSETILVASSDIPLVTGEAVSDFVREGLALQADLVYPIIRKDLCTSKYPQFKRTCLSLGEGTFTGGNMTLVRRSFAIKCQDRIEALFQARKKPLKLAAMIGFGTLIRVVLAQKVWPGFVSVPAIERAGERLVGGRLRALDCRWPEIGEDLDDIRDYQAAAELLPQARENMSPGSDIPAKPTVHGTASGRNSL